MANEENVNQKEPLKFQDLKVEGFPFKVKLKDFDGKVVFEMNLKEPLTFPYLFWQNRLFVTSRDESAVLLERSYHVFMMEKKEDAGQH